MGLREVKKQETRRRIAAAAFELFARHGYDNVPVARVAREAGVSEATLFNYFPTKEDLFFSGLGAFGDRLIAAVASRGSGTSVVAAFRDHVLDVGGFVAGLAAGDTQALAEARRVNLVVAESPALRSREDAMFARESADLAEALLGEVADGEVTDADVVLAGSLASALVGVHRELVHLVRRRVLDGDRIAELADDVVRLGGLAFDRLGRGLEA
ncbi:transcriptional regulator, TetR family [Beutenbergia cavernae DSM 12333]|uniref:Transcriptional regulator, TetR family n=1 Tax=Beutenbergia cavernae (strain ATCC BAA-8 / DSM 12333 / CCUG 43141 / JCM 11478 / NBRC 16432 / NCIMB 13614 / HKI 0122) TaxID=471853 RepID=C5C2J2_BEUC1|nr:TetR/AcrR family transcriptional regulator [Beutenbergia cavernae]ACQ79678.1 transcriptional regulator, TetR family [Beutenbergia cavernae DSM 12333]